MAQEYKLKITFSGEPDFHTRLFGLETYVTVNGEEYQVARILSSAKYAIRKTGYFGGRDELILERNWGCWQVRKRRWLE